MAKPRVRSGKKAKSKARPRKMRSRGPVNEGVQAALQWRKLLQDPCTQDLAYPCYSGVDNGYLIRTVDAYQPTATGTFIVSGNYSLDFVFSYTPSNVSVNTGYGIASVTAGTTISGLINDGPDNFITNTASVRGYRPVASCLKWVPTGAIQARAGEVGTGYMPDTLGSYTGTINNYMPLTQRRAANGEEPHEINWVPTAADENFTTLTFLSDPGCGTVFLVARGIDAKGSTTTTAVVSGYVEMTTIWEWTPQVGGLGVTSDPKAPNPFTSQQVLASAGDIKSILYSGVQRATQAVGRGVLGAAVGYARRTFMGISNLPAREFANSMPRLTY